MVVLNKGVLARWTCGWLLVGVTSCGTWEPADEPSEPGGEVARVEPARLSRDLLAGVGMEEVWFSDHASAAPGRPADFRVESVFLIDEGLFLVTRPRGNDERVLKMVRRTDGLSEWHEPIDGPIKFAPFAFTYPLGAHKSPELFFCIHDTVHCLDLRYGAKIWKSTMRAPVSTRVVADENRIFFGTDSSKLVAAKKRFSTDDWSYQTDKKIDSAPVFNAERVIYASNDGGVYGLTPETGWVRTRSWKMMTSGRIVADIANYSRWVFVGSTDYKLYCLEAMDGTVAWSLSLEGPIEDAPVVVRHQANREYAFCIARENRLASEKATRTLFAIELPKGALVAQPVAKWRYQGALRVVTVGRDSVFVLNEVGPGGEKTISALDIETGEEKFQLPIDGFHFVPVNDAREGRDMEQRGRIFLVSKTGSIQAIGEKP